MTAEVESILRDLATETHYSCRSVREIESCLRDIERTALVAREDSDALKIVEHIDLAISKLAAIKKELTRALEPDYVREHRLEKLLTGNWEDSR